ncbi:MAG: hypothetical protein LBT10_04030 [Methanobrevibacter sp.]|nr:hypothetical protein [Methanobrevibacter sp.]
MGQSYYQKYYSSQHWKKIRNYIILENIKKYGQATDVLTGKPILNRYIVDHFPKPVPQEYDENYDFFDLNNLRLLSLETHNKITLSNEYQIKGKHLHRTANTKQTSLKEHLIQESSPLDNII